MKSTWVKDGNRPRSPLGVKSQILINQLGILTASAQRMIRGFMVNPCGGVWYSLGLMDLCMATAHVVQ